MKPSIHRTRAAVRDSSAAPSRTTPNRSHRSFLQGNDFEDSPGHAIQDVSTHFPAQILGWPADSLQHRALEAELHSRMEKVLRALNIADRRSELGFSVVFDEGC